MQVLQNFILMTKLLKFVTPSQLCDFRKKSTGIRGEATLGITQSHELFKTSLPEIAHNMFSILA